MAFTFRIYEKTHILKKTKTIMIEYKSTGLHLNHVHRLELILDLYEL